MRLERQENLRPPSRSVTLS